MLFFLRAADGSLMYLLKDKQYSVGRKQCEILINNDQSISRKHAILSVKNNIVSIKDCASRYHTFVNKAKLEADVEEVLNHKCTILFGQLHSIYTFEEVPIITTTSSIKSDQKTNLRNNIAFLGGSVVQNWNSQCTHVTVEEIMLTAKVLCAIVQGIPIVKLKYWDDYVNNVKQNLAPPVVADYRPHCSEVILSKNVSLEYKQERKELFRGKVFVFSTKSEKSKIVDMIALAGGEAISWDTNPLTRADLEDASKQYLVLQTSENSNEKPPDTLLDFMTYYSQLGKRTIPLQEIALAIVKCSCEKDCNPDFDRKATVLATSTQQDPQMHSEDVLALPTQTQGSITTGQVKMEVIIPQSVDLDISPIENLVLTEDPLRNVTSTDPEIPSSLKRENESVEDLSAPKKFKVESTAFLMKPAQPKREASSNESTCETVRVTRDNTSLFAFKKRDKPSKEISSSSESKVFNPFSRKRKALQNDSSENSPKKSVSTNDTVSTPSTSLASASKSTGSLKENPFANILKSKSSASVTNSKPCQSFSSFKSKAGPQASSTMINENLNSLQMDSSALVVVDSKLERSFGWILKSNKPSCVKESMVNGDTSDADVELMKYIESFKNTVVIEDDKEEIVKKALDNNNDASVVNNNTKNFKTFKKIQPLKVQTTIIPESTYVDVICNQNCAIEVVRADSEQDSDDDDVDSQVRTGRRKGKRYQF